MPFIYETAVNLINVLSTLILSQALNDEVKAVQSGFYLGSPENLGNICSIIFFFFTIFVTLRIYAVNWLFGAHSLWRGTLLSRDSSERHGPASAPHGRHYPS